MTGGAGRAQDGGVPGGAPRRHDHLQLGRHGEDLVAGLYEAAGGTVLARNWRCRRGEVDLVVLMGTVVVFCEVKTRSSLRFGSPFEAVDARRQQRLRAAAMEYLSTESPRHRRMRFDVAAVVGGRIELREGAF